MRKRSKRMLSLLLAVLMLFFSGTQILASKNGGGFMRRTARGCLYLSDISYIQEQSFASGNHTIHLDENESNEILTLNVNETPTSFIKGICAWADAQIVYDLSDYSYDYFVTYLGVDASEQNNYFNTGVKFYIYTSSDGESWYKKYESSGLYGWSEAEFVKISITGDKYLKLVADDNSDAWWAQWYDEAVFADAKLIREGYEEDTIDRDFIKTVEEYDAIIKTYADAGNYEISGEYEAALLQREFVNNVGYDILQALVKYSTDYEETLKWLMTDTETLRLYLTAGKPEGSYLNSVRVLTDLYMAHQSDLKNTSTTKYGTKYCDLYRTMILALSLTESGNVYLWIDGVCRSDALTRYQIYKDLHLHKGQSEELIENEAFESLTVEEMRWVMNTVIDDEEIVWLNDYVRNEGEGKISPYNYITYTFDYDYSLSKYYSQENYAKWDEKYHLSDYDITYAEGQPKLWIVFEEGSVCGGLSKTGSCIWGAYKGLPNTCISQPAHCAYIYYSLDEDGNGIWNLGNNVSGWGQSGKTEHLNVRPMNDWGAGEYTTGWNANYILLAQAAQNEYEKYEAAEKILMLADIYKDNSQKLEQIYREALEAEEINFDAWLGLVYLYEADDSKTEAEYYALAKEIADTLTYYPYPMNDLLTLIKPHLTSLEYETMFTLLQTRALMTAASATDEESIQSLAVRQVANQLLGNTDTSIASFSFDGEDAGKIILSSRFDGMDVAWDYSLDGGAHWNLEEAHELQLSEEEIASINAENDIKVHIMGVDYTEENIYTIDIQESEGLPSNLYANDRENELISAVDTMEWKYQETDAWTSYAEEQPDLSGDTSVIVRAGATGHYLAQKEPVVYQFTEDAALETERYISIKELSIFSFSSEQAGSDDAKHAIDGNIYTIWHTAHDASDSDREIVIQLEEPVYLSALEYVPRQNGTNGRAKDVELYVSMDGENWTKAASASAWENNAEAKMLRLAESTQAQYVKFVTTENWGDGREFASAAMLNLFEDTTKTALPAVEISYDITEETTANVTAKLLCPNGNITITNNNGSDTYVFRENGSFTFTFMDEHGNTGSITAAVDWILAEDGSEDVTEPSESESESESEITPEPSESESESESQKPSESESESESQKPSESESESESQKPSESESESESQKPSESESESQKPSESESESQKPSESESEGESQKPSESESESESQKPSESESESESQKPSESESESESQKPSESESESESQKPSESESESESQKPSESESESESQKPSESESESESQKPSESESESQKPSKPSESESETTPKPSESETTPKPSESESESENEDAGKSEQFIYEPNEFAEKLKDADIVIKNDKVTITFQKESKQNDTTGIAVYDFTANVTTDYEVAAVSALIAQEKFIAKVSYSYSGTLPATATIDIFVGTEHAGKKVSYALLKEDGTIDEAGAQILTVDENGIITVSQEHCSEYVITVLEDASQSQDSQTQPPQTSGNEETPKTGDTTPFVIWLAVISVGLLLVVFRKVKHS